MRPFFLAATFLLLAGTSARAQVPECAAYAYFGRVPLCLPALPGYTEAYEVASVRALADAAEVPTNEVLGFYLNDDTYARADSLGASPFDDYGKLYAMRQLAYVDVEPAQLAEVRTGLIEMFGGEGWDVAAAQIDELALGVDIGEPQLLDEYPLDDGAFTIVLLTRVTRPDGTYHDMLAVITGLLLRERYVNFAYYLDYGGEASVAAAKSRSGELVQALRAANP